MGKEIIAGWDKSHEPNSPSNDGKNLTKEEKEKLKKRERKLRQKLNRKMKKTTKNQNDNNVEEDSKNYEENPNIEIEYVERDEYLLTGKYYEEFKNVFQYFATPKIEKGPPKVDYEENLSNDDGDMQYDQENEGKEIIKKNKEVKLSRKKRKQLKMLKVAQLKALVKRPDVVEVFIILSMK